LLLFSLVTICWTLTLAIRDFIFIFLWFWHFSQNLPKNPNDICTSSFMPWSKKAVKMNRTKNDGHLIFNILSLRVRETSRELLI
jgi:hypothetical protein